MRLIRIENRCPLVARLVDRWRLDQSAVLGGNALAAGSLVMLYDGSGLWQILLAVSGFGIGQAISINSQITLATRYAAADVERMGAATVISILRLFERLGSAMGPLVAGALLAAYGAPKGMALLDTGSLTVLGLFAFSLWIGKWKRAA
jgi:hypothetical protein